MGFWLLVGTLLIGEINHSRTYYRWWKYWIPNWLDEWDEWDDCEYTDTIDTWDWVTLGTNFNGVNEIDHLEDDQTHISTDYDHISDLIQEGTRM